MTIRILELRSFRSAQIMTIEALGHHTQETRPRISVFHSTIAHQAHWKVVGHHGRLRIW